MQNFTGLLALFDSKLMTFLMQMPYSVDGFFFMGGFFAAFVLVKKLKKVNFKSTPFFYLQAIILRALRILPAYAAALFFSWKLFEYVGNGPVF